MFPSTQEETPRCPGKGKKTHTNFLLASYILISKLVEKTLKKDYLSTLTVWKTKNSSSAIFALVLGFENTREGLDESNIKV